MVKAKSRPVHKSSARQSVYLLNQREKTGFEMRMIEHQLVVKERLTRQAGRVLACMLLIGAALVRGQSRGRV